MHHAQVSQSADRGTVTYTGMLPTLTTSSLLWSYKHHRFLLPEELFHAHGVSPSSYSLYGLTAGQARLLIGNSMSATTLSLVLVAVLAGLGRVG